MTCASARWPPVRPRPCRRPGTGRRPAGRRARRARWRPAGAAAHRPAQQRDRGLRRLADELRTGPTSHGTTHSSTRRGPVRRPRRAGSSWRATRSTGAPASARARPASRCQAARTAAGIPSYRAVRISGCRNASPSRASQARPRRGRLVQGGHQVGEPPAGDHGQLRDGEVHARAAPRPAAPRARGAERNPSRSAIAAEQRAGRRAARHLHDAAVGDGEPSAAGERVDQLGEVQRVAGAPSASRSSLGPACRRPAPRPARTTAASAAAPAAAARPGRPRVAAPPPRRAAAPGGPSPTSSSGSWRTDAASRPHTATVAGSAHWRSSTTSMHRGRRRTARRRAPAAAPRPRRPGRLPLPGADRPAAVRDDRVPPWVRGRPRVRRAPPAAATGRRLAQLVTRRPRRPGSRPPAARAQPTGPARSCRCPARPRPAPPARGPRRARPPSRQAGSVRHRGRLGGQPGQEATRRRSYYVNCK